MDSNNQEGQVVPELTLKAMRKISDFILEMVRNERKAVTFIFDDEIGHVKDLQTGYVLNVTYKKKIEHASKTKHDDPNNPERLKYVNPDEQDLKEKYSDED